MKKASLILASMLLISSLTGCGSSAMAEPVSVKGGYREEEIIFPYNSYVYAVMSDFFEMDGEPFFYESETDMFYSFNTDVTTVEREGKRILADVEGEGSSDHSHNGTWAPITNVLSACDSAVLYACWKNEKTCFEFRTDSGVTKSLNVNNLYFADFSDDGRLFIADSNGVSEVSLTTGNLTPVSSVKAYAGMAIVNDLLIAVDEENTYIYDIKEGKDKNVPKYLSEFFKSRIDETMSYDCFKMCEGDNGSVYICCDDGIFRFMPDGNQIEQIIDGVVNAIGSPSFNIESICCFENGTIIVSSENGRIMKYTYDPDMENEIISELKIYSFDKNDTLSQLVGDFASANRKIRVSYQYGRRNGISYSDARKEFTTRMLSGDAPDIIMIDGMDIENLRERKMLCDLSEYKDIWMPEEGLLDNTALWNSDDDGIYSVSCKFRIPAVGAEKKSLGSISSFHDLAQEVERIRKEEDPIYTIMNMGLEDSYVKLGMIYEGNNLMKDLSRERLVTFIKDCELLSKNNSDKVYGTTVGYPQFGYKPAEYRFSETYFSFLLDKYGVAAGTVNGFEKEYNILLSSEEVNESGIDYRLGMNDETRSFIPVCSLAITEAGKNREEALHFLADALSVENQKIENYDGFPVNSGAYDYFYRLYKRHYTAEYFTVWNRDNDNSASFEERWINSTENAVLSKYLKSLDEPVVIDNVIMSMIEDAFEKCDSGAMTAEQAAEEALGQLELRIKE